MGYRCGSPWESTASLAVLKLSTWSGADSGWVRTASTATVGISQTLTADELTASTIAYVLITRWVDRWGSSDVGGKGKDGGDGEGFHFDVSFWSVDFVECKITIRMSVEIEAIKIVSCQKMKKK